jgi:glutathione S-transferase
MMGSPYVRRVAISLHMMGIEFEHVPVSVFERLDELRQINPLLKVPTLVCDDGSLLVESGLILEYVDLITPDRRLIPDTLESQAAMLHQVGVALVAMEKVVHLLYETQERPEKYQYKPWLSRIKEQLLAAVAEMESTVGQGTSWLQGEVPTQADISTAVAWKFIQGVAVAREIILKDEYPGLCAFSNRSESLPEFQACSIKQAKKPSSDG